MDCSNPAMCRDFISKDLVLPVLPPKISSSDAGSCRYDELVVGLVATIPDEEGAQHLSVLSVMDVTALHMGFW